VVSGDTHPGDGQRVTVTGSFPMAGDAYDQQLLAGDPAAWLASALGPFHWRDLSGGPGHMVRP
jgi:hypothetical protein